MLYKYTAIDKNGAEQKGTIDTVNEDTAIAALQRNGFVITSIEQASKKGILRGGDFQLFQHVSNKDLVILSRQIATLFEAQVSALRVFRLLGSEHHNPLVRTTFLKIADDIQAGSSISKALAKHPKLFSSFYCNMVLAGEETGHLDRTFLHLADHTDRSYAVTSKASHALVYPGFIIAVFITVMVLMLTMVIPNMAKMIVDSGVDIPFYTKVVMAISNLFVNYGLFLFIALAGAMVFLWRYAKTPSGRETLDMIKISIPAIGNLYQKLYLARIADNLSTMLTSGISMVQAMEITAAVVENVHYEKALLKARDDVKNGASISKALSDYDKIPTIMVQMVRVGEETGELGNILNTLAKFYNREVENAVDTVLGLIEPAMIIMLAVGVGGLVASVLMPIYSITMNMQ